MLRVIIFDFDGVIVEASDIKTEAFARLFQAEGAEVVAQVTDFSRANGGMSRFDKFRHFYREFLHRELEEEEFQRLCRDFSSLVMEQVIAAPLVPGAEDFLERHHRLLPCHVASATPGEELQAIVKRRGLGRFFRGVHGSPRKKTEIISSILSEAGLEPGEAVFVGDALNDSRAAAACRVPFVGRDAEGSELFREVGCPTVRDLSSLAWVLGL